VAGICLRYVVEIKHDFFYLLMLGFRPSKAKYAAISRARARKVTTPVNTSAFIVTNDY
jgi:ABC-type iron transport system FetAB permease component